MRCSRSLHRVIALVVGLAISAAATDWTGAVRDIRTGLPIAEVEICGGFPGRYDATPKVASGADGAFSVRYQGSNWDGKVLMLNARHPGYLDWQLYRQGAGRATIELVPYRAFIAGRVVDAVTGAAVVGAKVRAGRPGAYLVSGRDGYEDAITDADGRYAIRVRAWTSESGKSPRITHGIDIAPDPWGETLKPLQAVVIEDYWLVVEKDGYRRGETYYRVDDGPKRRIDIPLLSHMDAKVFTRVDFRLEAADVEQPSAPPELVTVQPPPSGTADREALLRRIDRLAKLVAAMQAEIEALRAEVGSLR